MKHDKYRTALGSFVATIVLLSAVSLMAQPQRLAVGDTVLIKPKYRSTGVVLGFTGTVYCSSCPTALLNVDALVENLDVPMEVYLAEGLESSTSVNLAKQFKVAKVFDDETQAVTRMYRLDPIPAVIVIAPSGVVRYLGLPGTSSYSLAETKRAITLMRKEGAYNNYLGPVAQRARMIKAIEIPDEMLTKDFSSTSLEYDDVTNQFFLWNTRSSSVSYVLDSAGKIVIRYDMKAARPAAEGHAVYLEQWDHRRQRVLVESFDQYGSRLALYWFNMSSQQCDTVKDGGVAFRRRGGNAPLCHTESNTYIVELDRRGLETGDVHPEATMFVQRPSGDTFIGAWPQIYDRDTFRLETLYTVLALSKGGWYCSPVFSDTVTHYSAVDGSATPYHVQLPAPYYVHYGPGMKRLLHDKDLLRARKTLFSRLIAIMDDHGSNSFLALHSVPASVLNDGQQPMLSDRCFVGMQYNKGKREATAVFEFPQATIPVAVRNGSVACQQFLMAKPRIVWFAASGSTPQK